MKIKFLIMALVSVVLAACQKGEITPSSDNFPEDGVIRVTTDIIKTRAGHETSNLTEFGISVFHSFTTGKYEYLNIKMTKSGSDWSSESQMLWENSTNEVVIMAYAPYSTDNSYSNNPFVLADQSTEANVKASDFIYMNKYPFVPKNDLIDGKVKVDLAHMMAKLNFKIIIGTEFNISGIPQTNPISNIIVNGTKLKGQLSGYTDNYFITPKPTDNPAAAITPFMAKYTPAQDASENCIAEYEVILIPQTIKTTDKFEVQFLIEGREYLWKAPNDIELKSGSEYSFDFTVGEGLNPSIKDYYYSDGTYSSKLDSEKTCIGVIYWTDPANPKHVKIVSLQEPPANWNGLGNDAGKLKWGISYLTIDATDENNGLACMREIMKQGADWQTKYPAFAYAHAQNGINPDYSDGSSVWYLPSKNELKALYAGYCGLRWVESGAKKGEVNDWANFVAMPNFSSYSFARDAFNKKLTDAKGTALTTNPDNHFSATYKSSNVWFSGLLSGWVNYTDIRASYRVRLIRDIIMP